MASSIEALDYHSILIKNEAISSTVYLFVYPSWDSVCWISYKSTSIPAKRSYFYRSTSSFKYELRMKTGMVKRKIISPPSLWTQNKRLLITESGDVVENDLSECPQELQLSVRNNTDDTTHTTDEGRDLYAILKLEVKEVRKKPKEEQDAIIKKAYHKQMLLYHPDRNPDVADSSICQEIIMAYSILGDHKKRARYHDAIDYSGGWLSKSRWKALFKPEAHGSGEALKRIGLLTLSAALLTGGLVLSVMVPGAGLPVVVGSNLISGAAIGAGCEGIVSLVGSDTIEKGVDVNIFLKRSAIGGIFGAVINGSTLGIAAMNIGGECIYLAREIVVSEQLVKKAITDAATGAVTAVAKDVNKVVVDGKEVSVKKAAVNVVSAAAKGVVSGALGGMFTKQTKGVTCACEVAEKNEWKIFKKGGKLVEKAVDTFGSVLETIVEKRKETMETDGLNVEEEAIIINRTMCSEVITYMCTGLYFSRMIVEYSDSSGKKTSITVEGSGSMIEIPAHARDIKVRFQNQRFIGTWCDVKKYDRKKNCWCEPKVPHVFTFPEPVTRTFTLEGSLYYVAVMNVTNELNEQIDIME